MIAHTESFEQPESSIVAGIPLRWFQQIGFACDVFLADPKHQSDGKPRTFAEQIHDGLEIGLRRKAVRDRKTAVNQQLDQTSRL